MNAQIEKYLELVEQENTLLDVAEASGLPADEEKYSAVYDEMWAVRRETAKSLAAEKSKQELFELMGEQEKLTFGFRNAKPSQEKRREFALYNLYEDAWKLAK
jgi:hypothetical protein